MPLLICGTAHYAKCPGDVLLAMKGDLNISLSGSVNQTSTSQSASGAINELHGRLASGTRPTMHAGLLDIISSDLKQPPTVLPANFEAVVSHIRSLL